MSHVYARALIARNPRYRTMGKLSAPSTGPEHYPPRGRRTRRGIHGCGDHFVPRAAHRCASPSLGHGGLSVSLAERGARRYSTPLPAGRLSLRMRRTGRSSSRSTCRAKSDRAHSVAETGWLQGIADARGFPHGIVAYAALQDPELDDLSRARQHANLRGIRQILNPDQCERSDYLTDPAWRSRLRAPGGLWPVVRSPGAAEQFDAPRRWRRAPRRADGHQPHRHAARPDSSGRRPLAQRNAHAGRGAARERQTLGIRNVRSVVVTESIRPLVLEAIDVFGVDRCMFASNFPVDKARTSYDRLDGSVPSITAIFRWRTGTSSFTTTPSGSIV